MGEEGEGGGGERGRKRGRDPTEEEAVGVEGGEEGGVFGEMGDRVSCARTSAHRRVRTSARLLAAHRTA